jgi:hypothetical protein
MSNRLLLFIALWLPFKVLGQQRDSLGLDTIRLSKRVVSSDLSDSTLLKDDKKVTIDSLHKKNFLARRVEKVQGWSKPKKAAMLSFILPGAGQIYNKNGLWWRLPLCYGAYGFTIYRHIQARNNYFFLKTIYEMRAKNETLPIGEKLYGTTVSAGYATVNLQALFTEKQRFREPYERSFILLGVAHIFCIADAFVNAHLKSFDIDDGISLKVQPHFDWASQKPFLGLALQF